MGGRPANPNLSSGATGDGIMMTDGVVAIGDVMHDAFLALEDERSHPRGGIIETGADDDNRLWVNRGPA